MMKRSAWTLLLLLLCAVAGVLLVHAHAGHDHDHDHDGHAHGAAAAAVKKSSTKAPAQRMPPAAEAAHGHHGHDHDHDHDHDHAAHAPDGANDHDHDHDGHDDHDGHRTLKGSAAAHAHEGHDHAHGHGHAHHGHAHGAKTPAPAAPAGKKLATAGAASTDRFSVRIWSEALFATALVGAAPVVVLLFVPLGIGNQEAQKPLLRVFLSFAAGGLLGDALLHLLPHSMPHGGHDHHDHGHDHDHGHGEEGHHSHSLEDLSVWLWTIAGMMTFLMLEKFVRAQTGGHGHSHSGGGGGHGHSHGARDAKKTDAADASTARKRKGTEKELVDVVQQQHDEHEHGHAKQPIAAAGYLNLAADFAHNFTDGLAIGATFLRGSGWSTTVAMLLHELPHEIGDFAILIQSGFTRREAMLTQLLTAIGAMVGTVIGLLMEGAGDSNSAWISPFTAGGFIYIACASVMPELLEDCSLWQSLKEAATMCLGIGLMIIIALNE